MPDRTSPLCSDTRCQEPATHGVGISLPHGYGFALVCDAHGARPGERHGWTSVANVLEFQGCDRAGSLGGEQ